MRGMFDLAALSLQEKLDRVAGWMEELEHPDRFEGGLDRLREVVKQTRRLRAERWFRAQRRVLHLDAMRPVFDRRKQEREVRRQAYLKQQEEIRQHQLAHADQTYADMILVPGILAMVPEWRMTPAQKWADDGIRRWPSGLPIEQPKPKRPSSQRRTAGPGARAR